MIFANCLSSGIFPDIWKHANVVPVHKKEREKLEGELSSNLIASNFW